MVTTRVVSCEEFLTYRHWWERTPHCSVEEFLAFQGSCSHFFPRDPSVPIILWKVQVKLMYVPQTTNIKIFQFQNLQGFFLKSQVKTVKNPSSIDCPCFQNQSFAKLKKFWN